MLLTITTYKNAKDFGFLLHKHPDKWQTVELSVGKAHIFYPESSKEKATVALLLDIDVIDMVKKGRKLSGKNFSLGQYIHDRPYVTSSFMSVAIAKAFSTAMNGRCKEKPELLETKMPMETKISVLASAKGGELLIRKLFEPLGYKAQIERHILDEQFPEWGNSKYYTVTLINNIELKQLLSHLYVLLPALDNDKHYFVNQDEVNKLLEKGKGWLENHPEREQIANRYLINLKSFTRQALDRLNEQSESEAELSSEQQERKKSLHQQRLHLVLHKLKETNASTVMDLGCGEGKLIRMLLKEKQFKKIIGMDVSYSALTKCKERLHWNEMPPKQKERLRLFQGALTYKDKRLEGFDAAAIIEVIEHLDEDRLQSFEHVVFKTAKPKNIILTTPNREYNVMYEDLEADNTRHSDHRFEWSRKEFQNWANQVAHDNNYNVQFFPVGEEAKEVGAPSQMAVFQYGN